jgi:hypothetical protein
MDTSILEVKWLGDKQVKQEVKGSSVDGHEAHVFRAKNRCLDDSPCPAPPPGHMRSISHRARTVAARWTEGRGGEGEERARRTVQGRHEVGAEALRWAAVR